MDYPAKFPKHWHNYVELIAIPEDASEGAKGVVKVNRTIYEMDPGDILLVWPGELHEILKNHEGQMMALQFPLAVLTQLKEFAIYTKIYKNYHRISSKKDSELTKRMFCSLYQIFGVTREKDNHFKNVEILIYLYEMFMDFGNYIHNALEAMETVDDQQDRMIDKIQAACNYIQERCEDPITLETVAEYVGFSPCYFSKCFKKVTTYNFVQYLKMQRVKYLQLLLIEDKLSITEAAYQAGFKSISTLNRVFKQYCGCSPSEYKKYYKI